MPAARSRSFRCRGSSDNGSNCNRFGLVGFMCLLALLLVHSGTCFPATNRSGGLPAATLAPSAGSSVLYFHTDHSLAAKELRRYAYLLTNRSGTLLNLHLVTKAGELKQRLREASHSFVLLSADHSQLDDGTNLTAALLLTGDEEQQLAAEHATPAAAAAAAATATTTTFASTEELRSTIQRQLDACGFGSTPPSAASPSMVPFAASTLPTTRLTLVTAAAVATSTTAKVAASAATTNLQYAVYSILERWGARFDLHGDVLPDFSAREVGSSSPSSVPTITDLAARLMLTDSSATAALEGTVPLFAYRGLQPFHDFPEGPDWWDLNQYRHIMTQLSKMKMNFLGLHAYPYEDGTPVTGTDEPTVWVGTEECLDTDGMVKPTAECAYATSYANTMRNEWGYAPLPTSSYSWGTGKLFDQDCWGAFPGLNVSCPAPQNPVEAAAFFEATADLLEGAFSFGSKLGIDGCVGTETPLSKPTPPGPSCTPRMELAACLQDTPQRVFPTTVTISSSRNSQEWCAGQCALANHTVAAVEYGVACFCGEPSDVEKASKLPLGDCSAIHCAGNKSESCGGSYIMLAYNFSCPSEPEFPSTEDYYRGMFTRLLKRVPSLAWYWIWTPEAWEWTRVTSDDPRFVESLSDLASAIAARDAVNASWKMATNGWVVGPLPDRTIYDKKLPKDVWDAIASIDMDTGHAPVDPSYAHITQHAKWVIPWMEDDPDLTAPQLWVNRTLQHMDNASQYGCSGLLGIHWRTRAVSPQISAMAQRSWLPNFTSIQFWDDWVGTQFGLPIGSSAHATAASIFASVDSFKMPTVVAWSGGPGKMQAACYNFSRFEFVDDLLALDEDVQGVANRDRFTYWTNSFEYMRAIASTSCAWQEYNIAAEAVARAPASGQKQAAEALALPARIQLIQNATIMMEKLQATISTPGELGTYMNIESHSLIDAIATPAEQLKTWLEVDVLPPAAVPPTSFNGPSRVIVPTARTSLLQNETFKVRVLLLSQDDCSAASVVVAARPLGSTTDFVEAALSQVVRGRCVFELSSIAPIFQDDFEWYVLAVEQSANTTFPTGAPGGLIVTTVIIP
eukprot:INCI18123.1.p1 GENE.INCI18123.1~~INCI18123.1.p1  ORF type:complete len:1078 (+),score=169.67 INCI18123.1:152-3385(+)